MWVSSAAAVWLVVVVAVVVVHGQKQDHHHQSLPQQGEANAGSEDDGGGLESTTTRTLHQHTFQPNPLPDEQKVDQNITKGRENSPAGPVNSRRGSSGGGGGGRQQSGSGNRHGRVEHGGGRRQMGRGRRQRLHGGVGSVPPRTINEDTDGINTQEGDTSQQHTNAIILMLQRLSDRLSGIEVLQRQQTERIGTINYRLTKLELQAEERKGITNDLSNAVRHRMETTDSELDQVNSQLEGIKSNIMSLTQHYGEIKDVVRQIPTHEDNRENEVNGLKMQSMLGTLQGLKTTTDGVMETVDHITRNLTFLNKVASNLTHMTETMVTKQYLYENLNDLRSQNSAMSLLTNMMMIRSPLPSTTKRRGAARKGEPEDCWQLLRKGKKKSGVYSIQPRNSLTPFFVYCDMETDGGGWTVIQRREDGTVDFLREWAEYKYGFGNVAGEYWLGNEKIHLLTNQQVSVLRVDLADYDQQVGHALYSAFAVGSEMEGYSLKMLGQYSGDAGDSLRYHVGRRFSTIDMDNDAWPERSCARDHMGAWWYRACDTSNLNGRYLHGPIPAEHQYTGLYWYDFRGPQYSLWRSRMMIRRGGKVDNPVFKNFTEIHSQTDPSRAALPNQEEEAATTQTTRPFDPNQDPYVNFEYLAN